MAALESLGDEDFSTRITALVQAWEQNLAQPEPNRQRVFSDYQLLIDVGLHVARRLRGMQRNAFEADKLRDLSERVSSCLAFATIAPGRAAALKRHLFSGRSRGCRSGPAPLEVEIMESLDLRTQQD